MEKQLTVYASLHDDINSGWVWLPKNIISSERAVVKITHSGKTVFCEAIPIGENFLRRYNRSGTCSIPSGDENAIVANEWYRSKLGITTKKTFDFGIKRCRGCNVWYSMRAACDHPQVVVRVAMRLSILSVVLGAVSLFIAFCGK